MHLHALKFSPHFHLRLISALLLTDRLTALAAAGFRVADIAEPVMVRIELPAVAFVWTVIAYIPCSVGIRILLVQAARAGGAAG